MLERGKMERGVVELVDTESLMPQEHLLRKVDRAVDLGRIYKIVEPLYSKMRDGPVWIRWCCLSWCCSSIWRGFHPCAGRFAGLRQTSRTGGFWDIR